MTKWRYFIPQVKPEEARVCLTRSRSSRANSIQLTIQFSYLKLKKMKLLQIFGHIRTKIAKIIFKKFVSFSFFFNVMQQKLKKWDKGRLEFEPELEFDQNPPKKNRFVFLTRLRFSIKTFQFFFPKKNPTSVFRNRESENRLGILLLRKI